VFVPVQSGGIRLAGLTCEYAPGKRDLQGRQHGRVGSRGCGLGRVQAARAIRCRERAFGECRVGDLPCFFYGNSPESTDEPHRQHTPALKPQRMPPLVAERFRGPRVEPSQPPARSRCALSDFSLFFRFLALAGGRQSPLQRCKSSSTKWSKPGNPVAGAHGHQIRPGAIRAEQNGMGPSP
jgi:hypothetical protein